MNSLQVIKIPETIQRLKGLGQTFELVSLTNRSFQNTVIALNMGVLFGGSWFGKILNHISITKISLHHIGHKLTPIIVADIKMSW
ncbi:hypothetical protein BLX24_26330 [Arsenicibacter rosenii]|uniref:Uncharacterized protein n=1 Tax=Arsenicibacter rosenii TaxID=1750698 RepID=A0A1S2VBX5_9BACT|nr:hypothetical protein BLX24_26330 [Arsenicibacter rosenii]